MKIIKQELSFTDKQEWSWPDKDERLIGCFKQVADIEYIMKFIDERRVIVQAGGACGVWPYRFSQLFERVLTFEPSPENRECLIKNTEGVDNIKIHPYGLSSKVSKGRMTFELPIKSNNFGAQYFQEGEGDIETTTIDSAMEGVKYCDFIQLDIEGGELDALIGGFNTIKKYKPVICLEVKPLPQLTLRRENYKAASLLLEAMGYNEVGSIARDVIFKHKDK